MQRTAKISRGVTVAMRWFVTGNAPAGVSAYLRLRCESRRQLGSQGAQGR